MNAPTFDNQAKSHNYLHQGESSNLQFKHSNKGGFQPWRQPNLAHAQPSNLDIQHLTAHEQPSRPNVQHANSEGYQPWTQTDSIQGQLSNTHINHSNFSAFQNWKQPKLPHEESSNPPNIEEFQPLTRPEKPQGFRPYKKRG